METATQCSARLNEPRISAAPKVVQRRDSIGRPVLFQTDELNRGATIKTVCSPSKKKTVARVLSGLEAGRTERTA